MLNIIVCDDEKNCHTKIVNEIKNFFVKSNFEYKIHEFYDYNNAFIKIINEELTNKIYVLDIETPSRSGIDIARLIRKNDVESPIIFLTGHTELGEIVLTKDINFLSFINKFDNSTLRLNKSLKTAMKLLDKKHILNFTDRGSIYTIECDNILYITTDTVARKSIIITDKHEYKVNLTLSQLLNLLNTDFIQTHKSCIVNKSRIVKINNNQNIILFDNGKEIDMLSNKFKKVIGINVK